jgi:hypothetical protein
MVRITEMIRRIGVTEVWHDKDTFLHKGHERRSQVKILQTFTGNGDV